MGVTTKADELITEMRDKLVEALRATNEAFCEICIKDDCWGSDEIKAEFKLKITETQHTLAKLKLDLNC